MSSNLRDLRAVAILGAATIGIFMILQMRQDTVAEAQEQPAAAGRVASTEADEAAPAAEPAEEATRPAEAVASSSAEAKSEPAVAKQSLPTHKVKRGPFKVEVSLKGVFESSQMTEVVVRPEQWNELVVVEAVEQGTRVRPGDTLIALDTRKIDEQIRDLEEGRELAYLALQQAEQELALLEKSAPLDLESAERSTRIAREDLESWDEVDRQLAERSSEFMLKSAAQWLENAQEELRQLEKMYEADDLTEETEEIILKRQRAQVEFAQFYFEQSKIRSEQMLAIEIPRRDERVRQSARQAELTLEKLQLSQPTQINRKRLELAKLKYEQEKNDQRLARLQADRARLTVAAPEEGIVYYGKCTRGAWPGTTSMSEKLRRGGTISAHEVVMTIVQPRPMFVRAKVPEKELRWVQNRLQGKAVPEGYPDTKLPVAVQSVSLVPQGEGNFEARLTLDLANDSNLMPGMACTVKFVPYAKPNAISVPASAVFADELDDERHYVYLLVDGEQERRYVTVGEKSGDRLEILEGLSAGDAILTKRPDESASE